MKIIKGGSSTVAKSCYRAGDALVFELQLRQARVSFFVWGSWVVIGYRLAVNCYGYLDVHRELELKSSNKEPKTSQGPGGMGASISKPVEYSITIPLTERGVT